MQLSCILGIGAGLSVLWLVVRPVLRWRLRKIPGPWPYPILGHLPQIVRNDLTFYIRKLHAEGHGPIFKFWLGGMPIVVVSSPDVARKVLLRELARPDMAFLTMAQLTEQAPWMAYSHTYTDRKVVAFESTLVGEHDENARRGTLTLKGPVWRVARRAFEASVMHPKALAGLEPMIMGSLERLLPLLQGYADSGQPCDMVSPLNAMTMDVTGKAAFGVDLFVLDASLSAERRKALSRVYEDEPKWWDKYEPGTPEFALINHLACIFPDANQRADMKARESVVEACRRLMALARARQQSGEDSGPSFLGTMVSGSELLAGESMDEPTMAMQAFTMVLAGYETTSSTLSGTLSLLASKPEAQARAHKEIDSVLRGKAPTQADLERLPFCCAVIEEGLRMVPAGSVAVREATSDIDLGTGIIIPKGAAVWAAIETIQRDPAIWPRAEEFLPERHMQPGNEGLAPSNPLAHMPFGHGSRMCVGYKLALIEARLALVAMLQRFTFSPPPPTCPKPKYCTHLVFSSPHMWLTVTARCSVG